MSITIMSIVWKMQIPKSEKMLLLALADAANDDGVCWPSRSNLALKCGDSLRTIDRSIKKLIDEGYITIERRRRENGSQSSHVFQISLHSRQNDARGSDKMSLGVATKCRPLYEPKDLTLKDCASKNTEPPPAEKIKKNDHTWFTRWWCFAFAALTDEKYVYTAKAGGIVKQLLANLPLEELVARSCAYLAMPGPQRFPRGAPTLEGLTSSINQLAGKCTPDIEDLFFDKGLLPDFDIPLRTFAPWETPGNGKRNAA